MGKIRIWFIQKSNPVVAVALGTFKICAFFTSGRRNHSGEDEGGQGRRDMYFDKTKEIK